MKIDISYYWNQTPFNDTTPFQPTDMLTLIGVTEVDGTWPSGAYKKDVEMCKQVVRLIRLNAGDNIVFRIGDVLQIHANPEIPFEIEDRYYTLDHCGWRYIETPRSLVAPASAADGLDKLIKQFGRQMVEDALHVRMTPPNREEVLRAYFGEDGRPNKIRAVKHVRQNTLNITLKAAKDYVEAVLAEAIHDARHSITEEEAEAILRRRLTGTWS